MNIKNLKYEDFIKKIVEETRGLQRESGYEIHHIQPRSLGGSNDSSNLVKLTCFEHVIAHYILARDTHTPEMYAAFNMMSSKNFNEENIRNLTEDDLREIAEVLKEAKDFCRKIGSSWVNDPALVKKQKEGIKRFREENPEKFLQNENSRIEAIKNWWASPKNKESRSGDNSPIRKNPDLYKRISKNNKDRWDPNSPEYNKYSNYRETVFSRLKALSSNSEIREKRRASAIAYFSEHPEARENQSKIHKELWKDPKYRQHMMKVSIKGRKAFTDGKRDILLKDGDDIPEGFTQGSIKQNYKWFTNGENNTLAKDCPDGYSEGRIMPSTMRREKDLKDNAENANTLYDELKYKVNIPLTNLRNKIRMNKISAEEADIIKEEIEATREEILERYGRI